MHPSARRAGSACWQRLCRCPCSIGASWDPLSPRYLMAHGVVEAYSPLRRLGSC